MTLPFDLTAALKFGIIGLGAIMGVLAFLLLTQEQKKSTPRNNILNAIYTFMGFSVLLLFVGIFSEFLKKSERNLTSEIAIKSGFDYGALNGTYMVTGTDLDFTPENFKTPRHHYAGQIDIFEENDKIILEGTLNTYKYTGKPDNPFSDSLKIGAPFRAICTINNNYVAGTYFYGRNRVNGFGTIMMEFNNAANEAKAYTFFRTTTGAAKMGIASMTFQRVP